MGQRGSFEDAHRNNHHPQRWKFERRNSPASETCEDTESKEEQSCGEDSTGSSCTLGRYKRKLNEGARLKSTKKAKRKRENIESDWKERFEKMWERSLEL